MTALLTTDEAATRLQVSQKTVERAIARGELAVVRIGRAVRICEADIESFILANRTKGEPLCRSKNVVELGVYASKSVDKKLDALLGLGQPRKTRSTLRRKSGGMR